MPLGILSSSFVPNGASPSAVFALGSFPEPWDRAVSSSPSLPSCHPAVHSGWGGGLWEGLGGHWWSQRLITEALPLTPELSCLFTLQHLLIKGLYVPAIGAGSGDIEVGRCASPVRSSGPRCGNRYEIGASVSAHPAHHEKVSWGEDGPGGLPEEVTHNGSNRMRRWPKKSVGSIRGRRLEGYSSTMLVWGTSKAL